MRRSLIVVAMLFAGSLAHAGEPMGKAFDPNPLLKISDEKFMPVAKEIIRQDTLPVYKLVEEGGVSKAHIVYVDRSDEELRKEYLDKNPTGDADSNFTGYKMFQENASEELSRAVADVAAKNKVAKGRDGRVHDDSMFYEGLVMDPRVYQRAIKLLGAPKINHDPASIKAARVKLHDRNTYLGSSTAAEEQNPRLR